MDTINRFHKEHLRAHKFTRCCFVPRHQCSAAEEIAKAIRHLLSLHTHMQGIEVLIVQSRFQFSFILILVKIS